MPPFLYPIMSLPALIIGFMMMIAIANHIIGPVSKAAGLLQAPTKFQLSDFVWLVVQLQVVFAAASRLDRSAGSAFAFLLFLSLSANIAMWMGAVSCVSKAGIVHPWRRGVFILFLLPLALALMIAVPTSIGVGLILSIIHFQVEDSDGWNILAAFATSAALGAASWWLRLASHWVLQGSGWANAQSERASALPLSSAATSSEIAGR